jgi:hypothetical protein
LLYRHILYFLDGLKLNLGNETNNRPHVFSSKQKDYLNNKKREIVKVSLLLPMDKFVNIYTMIPQRPAGQVHSATGNTSYVPVFAVFTNGQFVKIYYDSPEASRTGSFRNR